MQISYQDAGVSIDAGNKLTEILNNEIKSDNIGNFAGLYEHPYIPEYFLVGCTDGVGTKVIPLLKRGLVETIATDLIAMNLNDLICTGAKPMFFLDYFATSSLDVDITSKFVIALKNELEILQEENWRSQRLLELIEYTNKNYKNTSTQIIPVLLQDSAQSIEAASFLQEKGFDIRAIRPPTVPVPRLRISLNIHRNEKEIDSLFENIKRIAG